MGFEDAFGILPCYFGMVKHFGGIRRGIAGNFQHFEADGNFMGGNRRNFQEIPATFGDSSRFFRRFLDYFRILKCPPPLPPPPPPSQKSTFFCEFLVILKSWFLDLFSGFSVTLVWPPNRSDWSKWNQFESVEMDEKIEPVQLKGIRQNRCNRPCRWWSGTSCSFQLHHTRKRKLSANCWRSPRHGRNLKKQTIN